MDNVYELIYMIKQKDDYAYTVLIEQFRYLFMKIISNFTARFPFLKMYKEDFLQEAFISLFESIEYYRDDQNAHIKTFILTCISRKIKTLIKQLFNQKNYIMCNAVSLDDFVSEDGDLYCNDLIESNDIMSNPVFNYEYNYVTEKFISYYDDLSTDDKIALNLMINKVGYEKAAQYLNCSAKGYDNKIQRIRRNLKKAISY